MNWRPEFLQSRLFLSGLILSILFLGCERQVAVRQYTEIFVDADRKILPPQGFSSEMPQDDIHAGLMPQDDIHAGLMPQGGSNADPMMPMVDAQMQQQINASVDRTPLVWETPKEWVEKKGSGLRLATFRGTDPEAMVEVTIVSLGGSAGGTRANVSRWMQQIGLRVPEAQELDNFVGQQEQFSTTSNLSVTMIDLTQLQNTEAESAPSMIAAVINREDTQVFVKMTGEKQAVLQNRDTFKKFVKSIRLEQE